MANSKNTFNYGVQDVERARRFLQKHKRYMKIHDETGLDYFWLCRFSTGKIKDPRASLLHKLLAYMIIQGGESNE